MRATVLPFDPKKPKAYKIDDTTKEVHLRVWFYKTKKVKRIVVTITAFDQQPGNSSLVRIEGYSGNLRITANVNVRDKHSNNLGYAEISEIHPQ